MEGGKEVSPEEFQVEVSVETPRREPGGKPNTRQSRLRVTVDTEAAKQGRGVGGRESVEENPTTLTGTYDKGTRTLRESEEKQTESHVQEVTNRQWRVFFGRNSQRDRDDVGCVSHRLRKRSESITPTDERRYRVDSTL